ncbi:MAG: hypothetical protein KME13_23975 [Myxacorys californica WJT36-NPBG1]|jgi:predicted amidohydrolase|nr:hypothetical protein [Myxacorys californica WJT36-NPBG1]
MTTGEQIGLLDYVVPLEQTVPAAPSIKRGDSVKVTRVEKLPQTLIGQIGIVSSMITADIAQIELEGQAWVLGTAQLEFVPAPQPTSPSGLDLWHEAIKRHADRTIAKLASSPNASRYGSVIEGLGGKP